MPGYCLQDAQFSPLDFQAEEVDRGKVQGGQQGEEREAEDIHHSCHWSILELAVSKGPGAVAILVQHPADGWTLHNLKLHLHRRLLGGETHIDRVHPEKAVIEILLFPADSSIGDLVTHSLSEGAF